VASAVDIIEEQIRALSTSDKEALLRVLLEELDGPPDPQVEAAWLAEVQRRDEELDSGRAKCTPAEEVFARLRAKAKQ
jgi:putative addiction module component (TIGR02574 family)